MIFQLKSLKYDHAIKIRDAYGKALKPYGFKVDPDPEEDYDEAACYIEVNSLEELLKVEHAVRNDFVVTNGLFDDFPCVTIRDGFFEY